MDKFIDYLFYLWVAALLIFIVFLVSTICEIKKEEMIVKTIVSKEGNLEQLQNDDRNNPFILEGKVKEKNIRKARLYYLAVPYKIREKFKADGWKVVITDKDISKNYYNGPVKGTLAGVTVSKEKTIYINHNSSHIRRSMIHEFGHYVDFSTNLSSETRKFKKIYNSEKYKLREKWKIDNHSSSNAQEYFAEAFQQFILYSDDCKKTVPQTYQYMNNLIKTFR